MHKVYVESMKQQYAENIVEIDDSKLDRCLRDVL